MGTLEATEGRKVADRAWHGSGGWPGAGVACAGVESVHLSTEQVMAVLNTFGVVGVDVGQDRDAPALVFAGAEPRFLLWDA